MARFVIKECGELTLKGLMTIGAIARSHAAAEGEENEDFICLRDERDRLQDELKDVSSIF